MLRIEKNRGKKVILCFFFAESFLFGSRQRSLCAESFLFGSRQSLLCREFFILLSAQKRTIGKASDSGSDYTFLHWYSVTFMHS
jgi:hypothetical protein